MGTQPTSVATPAPRLFLSHATRETIANYMYLVPAALCLGGTVLFPILKAMHMSLPLCSPSRS